MNDNEKYIEEFVNDIPFDAPKEKHRDELKKQLLNAFPKHRLQPTVHTVQVWRTIMKSRITKLAAAAVIIIAVLIGIHQFGSSIDGASVAWADVQQAFLAQLWVHVKYDNGRERWHNLQEGKTYFKNEDGTCWVNDPISNISHRYLPGEDHIIKIVRTIDSKVPPWQPRTAWDQVVGSLEKANGKHLGRYHEVEKHADTIDGQELIRFDVYFIDAFGQRILIRQVWADSSTRLPVRIRKKLSAGEQREQEREYITGDFDFPQTGPATIYDLGLPAHLKIVDHREREDSTSSEASKVIQGGKEASENFPSYYRSTIWEDRTRYSVVHMIYRKGHKISVSTYINMRIPENLETPITQDKVLKWTQTQDPIAVTIFDGQKEYVWERTETQPEVHVHRVKWPFLGLQNWFRLGNRFWPYVGWARGRRSEIITDHTEIPTGSIALLEDDKYFFVDPEKDYLCIKEISMRRKNGGSHKRSETCWSVFSQLPTGHWYPTKEHLRSFANPERGTSGHERYWNIDIKLLEDSEYPPDVFNGEKLLKGAKVRTY